MDEGLYADVETQCQGFHLCQKDNGKMTLVSTFVCPHGTVFNQPEGNCDKQEDVDCKLLSAPIHSFKRKGSHSDNIENNKPGKSRTKRNTDRRLLKGRKVHYKHHKTNNDNKENINLMNVKSNILISEKIKNGRHKRNIHETSTEADDIYYDYVDDNYEAELSDVSENNALKNPDTDENINKVQNTSSVQDKTIDGKNNFSLKGKHVDGETADSTELYDELNIVQYDELTVSPQILNVDNSSVLTDIPYTENSDLTTMERPSSTKIEPDIVSHETTGDTLKNISEISSNSTDASADYEYYDEDYPDNTESTIEPTHTQVLDTLTGYNESVTDRILATYVNNSTSPFLKSTVQYTENLDVGSTESNNSESSTTYGESKTKISEESKHSEKHVTNTLPKITTSKVPVIQVQIDEEEYYYDDSTENLMTQTKPVITLNSHPPTPNVNLIQREVTKFNDDVDIATEKVSQHAISSETHVPMIQEMIFRPVISDIENEFTTEYSESTETMITSNITSNESVTTMESPISVESPGSINISGVNTTEFIIGTEFPKQISENPKLPIVSVTTASPRPSTGLPKLFQPARTRAVYRGRHSTPPPPPVVIRSKDTVNVNELRKMKNKSLVSVNTDRNQSKLHLNSHSPQKKNDNFHLDLLKAPVIHEEINTTEIYPTDNSYTKNMKTPNPQLPHLDSARDASDIVSDYKITNDFISQSEHQTEIKAIVSTKAEELYLLVNKENSSLPIHNETSRNNYMASSDEESEDTFTIIPNYYSSTIKSQHGDDSEQDSKFVCANKDLNKYYPDPKDHRLFHYCSPGFHRQQVLDFRFICENETTFSAESQKCESDSKNT